LASLFTLQYDDIEAKRSFYAQPTPQPYLGLKYNRFNLTFETYGDVRRAASPPGFVSSGIRGRSAEGVPASASVTTRYPGAESSSRIDGLRPRAFAVSCIYAEPGHRRAFLTDCIVRVSGRNTRTAALYGPYDFRYSPPARRNATSDMVRFELPPPPPPPPPDAGELTDVQWDVIGTSAPRSPLYVSLQMDNFEYELVDKVG
jgi:hypothetical protein